MSKIAIDGSKCNGCMLCMEVCVLGNLEAGADGKVHSADGLACFDCGHCAAVCPTEAMSHADLADEEFDRIDRDSHPSYEQFLGFLKARRSRREFRDEPVPDDTIEKLIKAAVHAPSSLNTNSVQYTVITNRDVISEIAAKSKVFFRNMGKMLRNPAGKVLFRAMMGGAVDDLGKLLPLIDVVTESDTDMVLYNAPCVILQHAPKAEIFAEADYCYAAQNIQLAAESLGLGACVIGLVTEPMNRDRRVKALAGIPADHKVYCTIALGYPKFRYKRTAPKQAPKIRYVR